MKKRNNNRFLLFLGTIALALGFGATLKQKDIKHVGAAPIPAGTELFLKPNDEWLAPNEGVAVRFAAYFFTGAIHEWVDLVKEPDVLNIYKVTSPSIAYDNVIFTRMKGDVPTNGWGVEKLNQTGDLSFTSPYNLFTLANGALDGMTTTWSVYNPADHPLIPGGTVVYVTVHTAWSGTYDHLAAYYFRPGENAWVSGTLETPNVWKTIAPSPTDPANKWEKVIFVAMKQEENKWDGDPPKTADLAWDGRSDHFDIASMSWSGYVPFIPTTELPAGIDRNKVRLWLDRGGHYYTGYTYVLKIGETHYRPSGYQQALVFDTDGIYFPYYDLPSAGLSGTNIGIVILDADGYLVKELITVPFIAGDNNKLWRVDYNSTTEAFELTKGALIGRAYAGFIAKVLEGYLTCDANTDNGYMAFGEVNANFIPRITNEDDEIVWNVEGSLGGIMIKDYESEANYSTGKRETEANTDAYAKFLRMRTLFLAGGGTLDGAPERLIPVASSANNFIMLFSVMFGIGLLGFVILKKKKA